MPSLPLVNKNHSHYHGRLVFSSILTMAGTAVRLDARSQQRRAFWLKHLHQWHWLSAAACLMGLLLFAVTGFTLNHATAISAEPQVTTRSSRLPEPLRLQLERIVASAGEPPAQLPRAVNDWLQQGFALSTEHAPLEWSADELYISLPRPGGDAWLSIDLASGETTQELTDRGWISYLNDLHKGRNTGAAWSVFIDVFAFATLIFAITGLLLLKMHSKHRPATWPAVGFGLVLPLLIALLLIH
jgi:uncharacterized protein